MRVALVHEFLNQFGGAERVLLSLKEIFKEVSIYALLVDQDKLPKNFENLDIQSSFLQKWPSFLKKRYKFLLPFYPLAIEQFDLSPYDLVISDSNSFAKGVLTKPDTIHICYCHTPTRYLWDYTHEYWREQRLSNILSAVTKIMLHSLRLWDYQAAQRVDYFIANSKNIQKRIKKYYNRDSEIIYPPVEVNRFKISKKPGKYFLIVSRLSPYKKVDLAVEAFNQLKERLVIIGEGSELESLKRKASPFVKFLGFQSDEKIKDYYQNCRAFILPQEEDFGITPVEAMAYGKPIIAFKKGGVLELIIENKTGVFFRDPTAFSLLDTLKKYIKMENRFDPDEIRKHTEKFDKKIFQKKIKEFVKKALTKEDK